MSLHLNQPATPACGWRTRIHLAVLAAVLLSLGGLLLYVGTKAVRDRSYDMPWHAAAGFAGCLPAGGSAGVPSFDDTLDQRGVCEVHHSQMRKAAVPVVYGFSRLYERDVALLDAARTAFPNAVDWFPGGCGLVVWDPEVMRLLSPDRAIVYRCADCERARHQWETDWSSKH